MGFVYFINIISIPSGCTNYKAIGWVFCESVVGWEVWWAVVLMDVE